MQIKTQVGRLIVSTVLDENNVRETMVFRCRENGEVVSYSEVYVETHFERDAQAAQVFHFDLVQLLTIMRDRTEMVHFERDNTNFERHGGGNS